MTQSKPTILVVEDEPLVREVIVLELEEAGYAVIEAETGEDAVKLLQAAQPQPDLLFTDIRLPGRVNGWDVAEQARAHSAHLPVIYATGFSEFPQRRVAGSIFLTKPYRAAAVLAAAVQLGVKPAA